MYLSQRQKLPQSRLAPYTRGQGLIGGIPKLDLQNEINKGLVGYWSMSGGTIGNGTLLRDLSGKNNDGTLISGPTLVAGRIGQALNFNGTSSYIKLPAMGSVVTTVMTISCWIKTSVVSTNILVYGNNNPASPSGATLDFYIDASGKLSAYVYDTTGFTILTSSATVTTGNWVHVIFTRNAGSGSFYINGILDVTGALKTSPLLSSAAQTGIAADPINGGFFNGSIESFRIHNRLPSAVEIYTLFADTSGNLGLLQPKVISAAFIPTSLFFAITLKGMSQLKLSETNATNVSSNISAKSISKETLNWLNNLSFKSNNQSKIVDTTNVNSSITINLNAASKAQNQSNAIVAAASKLTVVSKLNSNPLYKIVISSNITAIGYLKLSEICKIGLASVLNSQSTINNVFNFATNIGSKLTSNSRMSVVQRCVLGVASFVKNTGSIKIHKRVNFRFIANVFSKSFAKLNMFLRIPAKPSRIVVLPRDIRSVSLRTDDRKTTLNNDKRSVNLPVDE